MERTWREFHTTARQYDIFISEDEDTSFANFIYLLIKNVCFNQVESKIQNTVKPCRINVHMIFMTVRPEQMLCSFSTVKIKLKIRQDKRK